LEAKDEEDYWRRKAAAASLRSEALSLDPSLGEPATGRVQGRSANLAEQYESHYAEGLKISAFQKGLGTHDGQKPQPKLSPKEVLDRKAGIVEALVKAGKSSTEITEYLEKLGPFLDMASLASDPLSASILYSRVMGGGTQGLGMKDVIDIITMVNNNTRGTQQQQSDPANMISAVARIFEVAQQRNPQRDPIETFNSAVQTVAPFVNQQNESLKLAYQSQIDMLKMQLEQNRGTDSLEFLQKWRTAGETLGLVNQPESTEVTIHKLHNAEANDQRNFEWNKMKYESDLKAKEEDRRQKAQNSMISQVTGTLEKLVESPVVKELGRNVGNKIGMPVNPLAQAQSAAAKAQLENPTEVPYSFVCPKCNTNHVFTSKQLTMIREKGGMWVCSTKDCSEVFKLRDDR
jgi:hypothetical protein